MPVNRSVVAARAAARAEVLRRSTVRPDLVGVKGAPGPIRRSRALPLTRTQRNSEGRRSEWSAAATLPYSIGVTAHDPRWSA